MTDPYLIPGTEVLRNLAGLKSSLELDRYEAERTGVRLVGLQTRPFAPPWTPRHLRAIHHHLFQDVYDWAGRYRTVHISKGNSLFASPDWIATNVERLCAQLEAERWLQGLDPTQFASRAAYYFSELNVIHPSREGNGRTQREWLWHVALECGYTFQWKFVTREAMIDASEKSLRWNDLKPLTLMLEEILVPAPASMRRLARRPVPDIPG